MRANRAGWVLAAAMALLPRAVAADTATYVLAGELVRVSLTRGAVTMKLTGPPAREVEVRVGPGAVVSSRGRPLRLADLRAGERIMAACADDAGGVRHAQRIKLGGKAR